MGRCLDWILSILMLQEHHCNSLQIYKEDECRYQKSELNFSLVFRGQKITLSFQLSKFSKIVSVLKIVKSYQKFSKIVKIVKICWYCPKLLKLSKIVKITKRCNLFSKFVKNVKLLWSANAPWGVRAGPETPTGWHN